MFGLGEFNDNGSNDWLYYDYLVDLTKTQDDVNRMNELFSGYNWKFKIGGYKYWGGAQATGAVQRNIILAKIGNLNK